MTTCLGKWIKLALLPIVLIAISGCTETQYMAHLFKKVSPGNSQSIGKYKVGQPYKIKGRWYYPKEEFRKTETGVASWYGPNFHGKPTANGEVFDQYALTAAHRTLQIPSIVQVTNLDNGRSLILRVNDRGPFSRGRILDVSKRGAQLLGFRKAGTARIRLEVMERESQYAANLARQGRSTAGIEIALNKGESLPVRTASVESEKTGRDQVQIASARPSVMATSRTMSSGALGAPTPLSAEAKTSPRPPQSAGAVKSAPMANVKRENLTPSLAEKTGATQDVAHRNDGASSAPSSLKDQEKLVRQKKAVSTELYVQAGAFSNYGNAARLRTSLARLGRSRIYETTVKGRKFYRVRIGPIKSVTRADTVLEALSVKGNEEAMIIVR